MAIMAVSKDNLIKKWIPYEGTKLYNLQDQKNPSNIMDLKVTPCNKYLLTAHDDGKLAIYDLKTGFIKFIKTHIHNGSINSLSISQNGKYLVTGGNDYNVNVYQLHLSLDELVLNRIIHFWSEQIYKVILDNDKFVYISTMSGLLFKYEIYTGLEVFKYNVDFKPPVSMKSLSLANDGKYLVVGLNDSKIYIYDNITGLLLRKFEVLYKGSVSIGTSNNHMFYRIEYMLYIYDIKTGILIKSLNVLSTVNSVKESICGKFIVTGSVEGIINVIDIQTYNIVKQVLIQYYSINKLDIFYTN